MDKEHFEILLEDIQSKFELMMEGQENLRKELSCEIRKHREETQEKFDMIAFMIEGLQKKDSEFERRFDGIDQRFDGIDQRFDAVDQRFDGIDQQLASMNERFDRLEHKVDTLADDFAKHHANTEIHAGYTVNEDQKGHEYH